MIKFSFLFYLLLFTFLTAHSQILCIQCYDQNGQLNPGNNNLVINGGFEQFTPAFGDCYCPNSGLYNMDFNNWTCTGGGSSTYASVITGASGLSIVVEGTYAAYMGNYFCGACNNADWNDVSCLNMDSACIVVGVPPGFPVNSPQYGGTTGVSLEQTVSGLTIGDIYIIEFWSGGEDAGWFEQQGMFGFDCGFGNIMFSCNGTDVGEIGRRYLIVFMATSTSHIIKFTNWGHICDECTEGVIDDVQLYTYAEATTTPVICLPTVGSFNGPDSACVNTCVTYNNTSGAFTSWEWTFNGGTPSSSSLQNPPPVCYNTLGTYTTQLIVSNGAVTDTVVHSIVVTGCPPVASFTESDTTICNGECIDFTNTSSSDASQWQWTFNGVVPSTFNGENPPQVCYINPGNFVVRLIVSNQYGSDTAFFTITVQDCKPIADFSASAYDICIDQCITYTNQSSNNAVTYEWIFEKGNPASFSGANPPAVCYDTIGTFSVILIVTNTHGTDTTMKQITVHPNPVVDIIPEVSSINFGESIQLTASGGTVYHWTPDYFLSDTLIFNPLASPHQTTVYTVMVTDAYGCTGTDTAKVYVIKDLIIPNAFSPDNDGHNDFFHLLNPHDVESIEIEIYNRWGELIYKSTDKYFMWNGKYQSVPQEIGVYVYQATYTMEFASEAKTMKGNITLLR